MTSTGAVATTTSAFTNPAVPSTTNTMSIDELMIWLGENLDSVAGEIKSQMDEIVAQRDQNAALQALMNQLRDARRKANGPDKDTVEMKDTQWAAWAQDRSLLEQQSWYQQLSPAGRDSVNAMLDDLVSDLRGGTDTLVSARVIDNTLQALSDEVNQNSSQNEMKMIRLQSLIAARSQAVQLATNELGAINDALKSVIANIRS